MLELMPFQRKGVDEIVRRFRGRCLLADEQGLGKTPTALVAAAELGCFGIGATPVVVICPASLRLNWQKEARKWLDHCLPANAVTVVRTSKTPLTGKLIIMSYNHATTRSIEIASLKPSLLILDESHYVKNRNAKRTRAIVPLCRFAPRSLLLTGTPVLNRPIELWAQLEALNFSLGTYWDYAKKYCNARPGRFGWDVSGASNIFDLNQKLRSHIMVRRLKSDVLSELPAKRRVQLLVDGVGRTKNSDVIRKVCSDALISCGFDTKRALELLRKKSSGVSDCLFSAYAELADAKVGAASEIAVDLASGAPLVIFAHHKAMLSGIATALDDANISFGKIDGGTPLTTRQQVVDDFQANKIQVALLSITAASTGLTLTAASDMLIAELPWGPGIAMQAEDRIHRIGQKNAALIRYLVAEGTLDETLWSMICSKSSLAGGILDADWNSDFDETAIHELGSYWSLIHAVLVEVRAKLLTTNGDENASEERSRKQANRRSHRVTS